MSELFDTTTRDASNETTSDDVDDEGPTLFDDDAVPAKTVGDRLIDSSIGGIGEGDHLRVDGYLVTIESIGADTVETRRINGEGTIIIGIDELASDDSIDTEPFDDVLAALA